MKNTWNEIVIQKEFVRLDAKAGLKGAILPITFSNAKCILGFYSLAGGGVFRFTKYYFDNSSCPIEEALDHYRIVS